MLAKKKLSERKQYQVGLGIMAFWFWIAVRPEFPSLNHAVSDAIWIPKFGINCLFFFFLRLVDQAVD